MFLKRCILGILSALLLCAPLSSSADTPEEAKSKASCEELAKGFSSYVAVEAASVVANSKGENPELVELRPQTALLECLPDGTAKVRIDTHLKIRIKYLDPKTKKVVADDVCAASSDVVIVSQKGSQVEARYIDGRPSGAKEVPCK